MDDEPGMRYATRRTLEPRYDVTEVATGEEALERIGETSFDIAIVDYRLPGISGLELLAAIKVVRPATDVVIMTGSAKDPDEALLGSIRRKAFFFLRKPFSAAVLETLVDRITETQVLEERLQEHARRLEEDMEAARFFQQAFLPPREWKGSRIEIAGLYVPSARLSGDLIDYWMLADGSAVMVVADVMGHGASAAMMTGVVKSQLRSLCAQDGDPGTIVTNLDGVLHNLTRERFLTMLLVVDDPRGGKIRFCGAGHPWGLLRSPAGAIRRIESTGIPLNLPIPSHPGWTSTEITREPGSRLLLYTDGFADATSPTGELFSEAANYRTILENALAHRPVKGRSMLEEALLAHTNRLPQEDDRALLVAEMN